MTPDRPTPACACKGTLGDAQVTHTRDACTKTWEGVCPVTGCPERGSYTVMGTLPKPPKPPKAKPRERTRDRTRDRLRRMSQRRSGR